jgi:diguanylate cyclase (GGDEF)-like protein
LIADDAFSDRAFGAREEHLLVALANLTAIAVEKGRLFQKMRALAEVDGLTGLANRRTYDAAIDRVLMQSRQTGRAASLVLIDVDHFKQFNDRHGHLAGDDALKTVASILASHTRKSDLLARYGGEEFVLLLPETNLDTATMVAEKMVAAVREESALKSRTNSLTISAGVATSPAGFLDRIELFTSADRAVYEAKRKGRNRVEFSPAISLPSSFPPPPTD